jgi:predicted lipid carrier protein YhbT
MAAQFHVIIANEALEDKDGKHSSPNITITMKQQDFLDMINGKLNGQMAFMSGKLKIAGDMGLALKLQGLFRERAAGSSDATTIEQVRNGMKENFNQEAAKGLNAVYQYDLTD